MVEAYEDFVQRMSKFGDGETRCGPGSTLAYTEKLRDELPDLINKYRVNLLIDAGCGDQNWIKHVDLGCEYQGFDLHSTPSTDISKDVLPQCDLIMCRDVMIHMPIKMIQDTLKLFSQSSYLLLATSYDTDFSNADTDEQNRRLHLGWPPFDLSLIDRLEERDEGKFLGLWAME
jgi:hypothetical protein